MKTLATNSRKVAFLIEEGGDKSAAVLGNKGVGLVELDSVGARVPPAFTISTSVARAFAQHGQTPKRLQWQLRWNMEALEKRTGKKFGCQNNPLLVSVRSGAAVSMPGMMDTVLNLGINPVIVRGLARSGNARFAWDCYRRFLSMFGNVVLEVPRQDIDGIMALVKRRRGAVHDSQLDAKALQEVCSRLRTLLQERSGNPVPDDVHQQLEMATLAVLRSWNNPRAKEYRRIHRIPNNLGTAVNIQSMVYGNLGPDSGTGVAFSRNPSTGEPGMWGEFLVNGQGEDVVAGTHNPLPIEALAEWNYGVYQELSALLSRLDSTRRRAVEVEFTVESGVLYSLQVRNAKLSPEAAATIAVHSVWSKWLPKEEAVKSVSEEELGALQALGFDERELALAVKTRLLARGVPAAPGAAVGRVVTTAAEAVRLSATGEKVILVRPDTCPDDLQGMIAAVAIVTMSGGASSHAAVVARGLGKPAVVGVSSLSVRPGEVISVDGRAGVVIGGAVPLCAGARKKEVNLFLRWVAQEEAKKWPAPRLDFAAVNQQVPVTAVIGDFYLADAMDKAAAGTPLEMEARRLRTRVHTSIAETVAMYLVVAVGGEMRHAGFNLRPAHRELQQLRTEFGIQLGGPRGDAQLVSINKLKGMDRAAHIRFLELTTHVFNDGAWGPSVGGFAWGKISKAALLFLKGELSHSVFADHAFDLEHNNGTVFGKHMMITCDRYNRSVVYSLLQAKKFARGVDDLHRRLLQHGSLSKAVLDVFNKGRGLRLW